MNRQTGTNAETERPLEGEILSGSHDDHATPLKNVSQKIFGDPLKDAEKKAGANEKRVRKGFWKTVAKAADRIPFMEDVIAAYYCAMDPRSPTRVRAILLAGLAYFVLPLDSIPDFLLGFGFTDDIAVLTAMFGAIRGNIQPRHTELAREKLAELAELKDDDTASAA